MATPVVGYDAIAVVEEEQHLCVPIIGRQRPTVTEYNGLTFAPVFIIDLGSVLCRYCVHSFIMHIIRFGNASIVRHDAAYGNRSENSGEKGQLLRKQNLEGDPRQRERALHDDRVCRAVGVYP